MEPLVIDAPPFDPPPPKDYRGRWGGDLNGITWIRPELVIRAELGGWTRDGVVRQTSFKGIETGRDPKAVVREDAVSSARAVAEAEAEVPEPASPADSGKIPSCPSDRRSAVPPRLLQRPPQSHRVRRRARAACRGRQPQPSSRR